MPRFKKFHGHMNKYIRINKSSRYSPHASAHGSESLRPCVEEKVIERKMAMVGTHLSGITRFLSPISGESTSAKRQTYTCNGQLQRVP